MKSTTRLLISTVVLAGLVMFTVSLRKLFPGVSDTLRVSALVKKGHSPSVFPSRFPFEANHPEQPVPATRPGTDVSTQAKTAVMTMTDAAREQGVDTEAPPFHWQQWQTALFSGDVRQIPIQGGLLAESLRQKTDSAIYQDMATLLSDPDLSLASKNLITGLLGEIATVEAMAELLLIAQQGNDSPLYPASLQAMSQAAANRWDGRFHQELSPALEQAWQDMQGKDSAYAATLAKAIASVGTPTGVDMLLDSLTDPSRQINVDETLRLKQKAAFAAIPDIRNPAAIATLSQHVSGDSLGVPGFEVSGLALASMGAPEATEQLLNWSETAPAAAATRIEDWFSKVQDSASVDLLLSRRSTLNFQSPAVESAFDQALNYLNPPLDDLTTPIPQPEQGNGYEAAADPFAGSMGIGPGDEGLAETGRLDNGGLNSLEQALQSDLVQVRPRKKRRAKAQGPGF